MRRDGHLRKQWRYAAAFADEVMVCAGRVRVGPLGQTFWAICDRRNGEFWEGTSLRLPGGRGSVWTEVEGREGIWDHAPDAGSTVRLETQEPDIGEVKAFLRFRGGQWVESVCPTPEDQYVWTRKRVDMPVECDIRIGHRRWQVEARGVEDESEGYHPHHTVWSWSAGVGTTGDGRSVGWNLVSGINDPPERSERAIWVDGEPFEPGPVSFEGLEGIGFDDGSHLAFQAECERRKEQNLRVVRYTYRQPFGTFSGTLPRGLELERGLGVMEHHDAIW
jgi:hypothetical protein